MCTHPERGAEEEEEDKSESESGEPFCLEDILDAVTFEDEPLRTTTTTKTTTTTTTQDPEDGLPEDPEMAMMETESVISEDVQLMEDVRSRPCEFIPPPPPDEPPPDYPPDGGVSAQYADKSTVVGEDNASLAPASLKNSPVASKCLSSRCLHHRGFLWRALAPSKAVLWLSLVFHRVWSRLATAVLSVPVRFDERKRLNKKNGWLYPPCYFEGQKRNLITVMFFCFVCFFEGKMEFDVISRVKSNVITILSFRV